MKRKIQEMKWKITEMKREKSEMKREKREKRGKREETKKRPLKNFSTSGKNSNKMKSVLEVRKSMSN